MNFRNNMNAASENIKFYAYSNYLNEDEAQNFSNLSRFAPNVQFSSFGKHIVIEKNAVRVIDSEVQLHNTAVLPAIKDVIAGYNCFLLLFGSCNVSFHSEAIRKELPSTKQDMFGDVATKVLNSLFLHVNTRAPEATVHVSLFEVLDDDYILDVLRGSKTHCRLKAFKMPNQPFIEIEGLDAKPITSDDDVSEILLKRYLNSQDLKYSRCSHSVMFATVLEKTVTSGSLEFLNAGRFTLVHLGQCVERIFSEETSHTIAEGLKHHSDVQNCREIMLKKILRNAIGGNAKTTIIMNFNITSPTLENELKTANFVLKMRELKNRPTINHKLIDRGSREEFVEEIQELGRDITATKNKVGLLLCHKHHSWLKNSLIFDVETLKSSEDHCQNLINILNYKKQYLARINVSKSDIVEKIKEEEKTGEIQAELEKTRNARNSINEKISSVSNEVLSLENISNTCKTTITNLTREVAKKREMFMRATENIWMLKKDLDTFYETAQVEFLSFQTDLESILVSLKNHLENVNVEKGENSDKLNSLNSNANSASNTWKFCMDTLLSNLHVFIDIHNRNCCELKENFFAEMMTLNKFQQELVDILHENRNIKIEMVSSFSQKIQISTESSMEILAEISTLLDEIQTKIRKQLKVVEVTIGCSGKELVKCIDDLSHSLRKCKQYFPQQEKSSTEVNTHILDQQQSFRESMDSEIMKIKNSLQCIREMYSVHNECAVDVWNQRQGDIFQMKQNMEDLVKSLAWSQELPKICKNAFCSDSDYHYSILKDSNENDKNMHCQLKDFHNEMKCTILFFLEENQKFVAEEEKEINKLLDIQCENITRNFDDTSFKIEMNSKYVSKELQNMQKHLSSRYFDLKENISGNLALLPEVEKYFTQLQSVPQNILMENDKCVEVISEVNAVTISEMESNESDYFIIDLSAATSSTPNSDRKKRNSSVEKQRSKYPYLRLFNSTTDYSSQHTNLRQTSFMVARGEQIALQSAKYKDEASELEKKKNEPATSLSSFNCDRKVESNEVQSFVKTKKCKK